MTDIGEFYTKFLDIEENLDLFSLKIQGISFWERVRFEIFSKLVRFDSGLVIPQDARKRSKLRYYISAMIDLMKNPFLSSSKKVLFVGSPRRILRKDGFWWDIYTDPVIEQLNEPSLSLEYSFLFTHSNPPRTKNLRYLDFIELLSHIRQTFGASKVKISRQENTLLLRIREEIVKRFGIDIDIKNRVTLTLEKREARLPLYQFLLRRIQPKIVVVAVAYGKEDFIEACKSLKIPVAELQHGIIHKYHIGYSFEGPQRRKFTFPDYFLAFGDFWSECIDYPIEKENVISVGFPLIDEKRLRLKNVLKKKQIIFISQPQSGELLSKTALDLSRDKEFSYEIVYKLHSAERVNWKESYPWLVDSDVRVIDTRRDILHRILSESEIQIGVGSTAIYEGLAFGLKTYLMNGPGIDYFHSLIESGTAILIDSAEDLKQKVLNSEKFPSSNIETFFKTGAAQSILDFVEQFIDSK